jgi:RND family efflux transporter MFP subunit
MTLQSVLVSTARMGIALAALVLIVLWMSGAFGDKIEPGEVPAPRRAAPAGAEVRAIVEEEVPVIEEAAGTVQAARRTSVSSRILADIADIKVRAGDAVEEGDLLVELDSRGPSAEVEQARRAVDGAEAALGRTRNDFERARQLHRDGVISRSEFDRAESAFRVADAEMARAREALLGAEVALSYTAIKAPVSGRVIDRLADPGDTAMPGKPLLSLYDPTALRIEVPVRESLVSRLQVGDRIEVRMGTAKEPIVGAVDEIVPQAEAGSRTFLVKIGLPRHEGTYTGMFGRAILPAGTRRRVVVPAAAVEHTGQLTFVNVVDGERQVSRRLVTLGPATSSGDMEVLSGLRPGEEVWVPGGRR